MMYKYAQILNNKVHWIMSDEMTLDELYTHKFCKDHVQFVEITGRDDIQEGWDYDGQTFTPPPTPKPPTVEELLIQIRAKRNQLLSDSDWTRLDDNQLTTEQKQAWAAYRQELRDFPSTCDPYNPVWPTKPQ